VAARGAGQSSCEVCMVPSVAEHAAGYPSGVCGRYASTRSTQDLVAEFDAVDLTGGEELGADYNVAPTKRVHVIRESRRSAEAAPDAEPAQTPTRVLDVVKWGLVPSWSKDPATGGRMLNARAESLTSKPAFRAAFSRRRCIVPADGWFEWTPKENEPGKQAFYMTPSDGSVVAFAGLWEVWGEGDDRLYTCTIVTTDAIGDLTKVHDRMPLLLPQDRWAAWLGETEVADRAELIAPPPQALVDALEIRPVGSAVGNVRNNGVELLGRVDTTAQTLF
jgi:putative SOS response-associated peptidase YedK